MRRPARPALVRTLLLCLALAPGAALAQRAGENATTSAGDGFGATVGNERVGIYSTSNVRGFSPITAGNRRLDGLYFDMGGNGLTNRLVARSTIRVGISALAFPFPAPSGIVDYELRKAGPEPVLSVAVSRPTYGGQQVEIDAQAPLTRRLSVAAGLSEQTNVYDDSRGTFLRSAAVIPTLAFDGGRLTAILSATESGGDVPAYLITKGPHLPPDIDGSRFGGQSWIDNRQRSATYGLLGDFDLTESLTLRFGAIESRSTRERTFTDLYLDVKPDGSAQNLVVADPALPARWTSGEARLSWSRAAGAFENTLVVSVRGRNTRLEVGSSPAMSLGPAQVGRLTPAPRPDFIFPDPTVRRIEQASAGLAWLGRWNGLVEWNLGLQKTDYSSIVEQAGRSARTQDSPWLYNATAVYTPRPWLGVFAGVTTGLEETSSPPSNAANRNDAIPASRTKQYDGGARILVGDLRLVLGAFQIERPYYSLDARNIHTALGELRNRGLEVSLAGPLTPRLSVVAGLVLMDPQVLGAARNSGRAGERPVGSTGRLGRLDLDYRVPGADGLSLTAGVQYSGPVVASTTGYAELGGHQLEIPGYASLDLGARYRFTAGGTPMTARLQVLDVTDLRRPAFVSSNTFFVSDRRRFSLQLTADF